MAIWDPWEGPRQVVVVVYYHPMGPYVGVLGGSLQPGMAPYQP